MSVRRSVFKTSHFKNLYLWLIAKTEGQFGRKPPVELQRNQLVASSCQYFGNRSMAWADLDDGTLAKITKSVHDGVTGRVIDQKILPQLRLTFHLHPMFAVSSCALL